MTLGEAYSYSVRYLDKWGIDEAKFKALCVCCEASGVKNSEFLIHRDDETVNEKKLFDMLERLKNGGVLQYIIGKWSFYKYDFSVGEGVLIPRPETEKIVEYTVDASKRKGIRVVFDLCSGSGCIGISIARELKDTVVYCVEKSEEAFRYLVKNANGVTNVRPVLGDIMKPETLELTEKCDIIVSNPPYIKSEEIKELPQEVMQEPRVALDGGEDGLDFYRAIASCWVNRINPGGEMIVEIDSSVCDEIKRIFSKSPLQEGKIIKDIYGCNRFFAAVK